MRGHVFAGGHEGIRDALAGVIDMSGGVVLDVLRNLKSVFLELESVVLQLADVLGQSFASERGGWIFHISCELRFS